MLRSLHRFALVTLIALSQWAGSTDTALPIAEDPVLEKRVMTLAAELRCLVCQNQSLADSHASLAVDLKNQIRDMAKAGKSDAEIKQFMTDRYGDFVLYRPPVKNTTLFLWVGPFVVLLAGLLLLFRYLKRRKQHAPEPVPLSVEASERARALLEGDASSRP